MSGNLSGIIVSNLPDVFEVCTAKDGRDEDGRGQARQALARAACSGEILLRGMSPVETPNAEV